MLSFIKNFVKNYIFVTIGLVIIAIIIIVAFLTRDNSLPYDFVVVQKSDLVQEISLTGKVRAAENVDLAFESTGKITKVYKKIGEPVVPDEALVQIYNEDLLAKLKEAEANVKIQQAKLDELKSGTREEELEVQRVKVENAKIAVEDEKINLVNKLKDAYTKADDAIRNKADVLFDNPRSSNPQLNISITSTQLESDIEADRVQTEQIILVWSQELDVLNVQSDLFSYASDAQANLAQISNFLAKMGLLVNNLTVTADLTQTSIDSYKADISSARTNINAAITNVSEAEESLRSAQSNLVLEENQLILKEAGSTPEAIAAQEATLDQAKANVDNYKAQISKTIIRAPINGVVSKLDIKAGEIATAGNTIVSIIGNSSFEIEVNVPEADVAKVKLGDTAKVTLDAYGNDIFFEAVVVEIEPAETVIEGVSTYKTTLQFIKNDERIKSGMTANIDILTAKKEGVIAIPQRAVITKNGDKMARIVDEAGELKEVLVKTGLRGSDATIEIIEGLKEGDRVVTFIRE